MVDEIVETTAPSVSGGSGKKKSSVMNRRDFLKFAVVGSAGALLAGCTPGDNSQEKAGDQNEKKFNDPLANTINKIINSSEFKGVDPNANPETWAGAIKKGFERVGLVQSEENVAIVLTLIRVSSGFRNEPLIIGDFPTPKESVLNAVVEPRTSGPMEVNYQYVMALEGISDKDEAIKKLMTIEDGTYYGIRMLKDIIEYYKDMTDNVNKVKCIFADWNAGIGRSKRAGLSAAVAKLTGDPLKESGYLLTEDATTKTIPLVESIKKLNIGMNSDVIQDDLGKDTPELEDTNVWKKVQELQGSPIESVPADVEVPGITGAAKEILFKEGTSRKYAEARFTEFTKISEILTSNIASSATP